MHKFLHDHLLTSYTFPSLPLFSVQWQVYQKWNQRLFDEMYGAYRAGRSEKDPSEGWYEGELWFFDNYIIPLANKLNECGVFGVSGDEYLTYAVDNRREWEIKGIAVIEQFIEEFDKKLESEKKSLVQSMRRVDDQLVDC